MRRHGETHVSAVAAARDHHALGIEIRLPGDPIEQCADILDRIFAQHTVVEIDICLPEARGAAYIGLNERDAALVDVVVVTADKTRTRLRFAPTVNLDAHVSAASEIG